MILNNLQYLSTGQTPYTLCLFYFGHKKTNGTSGTKPKEKGFD